MSRAQEVLGLLEAVHPTELPYGTKVKHKSGAVGFVYSSVPSRKAYKVKWIDNKNLPSNVPYSSIDLYEV